MSLHCRLGFECVVKTIVNSAIQARVRFYCQVGKPHPQPTCNLWCGCMWGGVPYPCDQLRGKVASHSDLPGSFVLATTALGWVLAGWLSGLLTRCIDEDSSQSQWLGCMHSSKNMWECTSARPAEGAWSRVIFLVYSLPAILLMLRKLTICNWNPTCGTYILVYKA